jgi:hypothetical protein
MTKAALRKIGYLLVIVDAAIELWGIGHYLRKRYAASSGKFRVGDSTAMIAGSRNERD